MYSAAIVAWVSFNWAKEGGRRWWAIIVIVTFGGALLAGWRNGVTELRARLTALLRRTAGPARRFVLRISPSELSLTSDGVRCMKPIPLDRITGFSGDARLHAEVRDGASVTLPCCLTSGEHRALAAELGRLLVDVRAAREQDR